MSISSLYVEARSLVRAIAALEALDSIDFELHAVERRIRSELIKGYRERLEEILHAVGSDEATEILMPAYEILPIDLNVN